MMRSLFSGVSGLKNHQVKMDVIGNNISNVNTVGFKSGRVTFQESLTQMLRDASRPYGTTGGINPMQIGLGTSIGSIDTSFEQGNLETTGNTTDLAIQGDAFFVLNDGISEYYARAGNFVVDGEGRLVHPQNGFVVQGKIADAQGEITSGATTQDIVLPFGQKSPASATSEVEYSCNLDSDTQALAQIWASDFSKSAAVEGTATPDLTITAGTNDTLNIIIDNDIDRTTPINTSITLTAGTYTNVSNIVAEINNQIDEINDLRGEVLASVETVNNTEVIKINTVDKGGTATFIELGGNAIDNAGANLGLANTRHYGTAGASELNELSIVESDMSQGDVIRIVGTNPDQTSVNSTFVYGDPAVDASYDGTTLADLIAKLDTAFSGASASLDEDGLVRITDSIRGETKTSVTLTFSDEDTDGSTVNFPNFYAKETGRDAGTHTASITVYDSKGATHSMAITFTNTSTEELSNVWSWEVSVDNGDIHPSAGHTGEVRFNSDGSMSVFNSDDGRDLTFDPGAGADTMSISLDGGETGSLAGITQLDSPTTTVAKYQDGFGMGNLQSISVAETGEITGHFTNGVSQNLAQIVMAKFNNPAGLKRSGDNVYLASANSGTAVKGTVGGGIQSSITSGALEMSNVDLAEEFTDMIVAQRGFQANARVITTTDDLLNEITQLKR